MTQLKDRLQEQQQQFRRELHELNEQITQEDDKLQRVIAQAAEQQAAAQSKIATLEKTLEKLNAKADEADSHRE